MSRTWLKGLTLASLGLSPWVVFAAGFQIQEQNAASLGTAYSGTAAIARDASSAFYNSAALTWVPQRQYAQAFVLAHADVDFQIGQSLSNIGTPSDGAYQVNPGGTAPVPAFHYATRLDPRWVFGLSAAAPFGVKTEYAPTSAARYLATKSAFLTYMISPSLAYRLSEKWSLGFGADAGYVLAELNANIGVGDYATDGYQVNKASAWGLGWHVGMLYEYSPATRFGVNVRSRIPVAAQGKSVTHLGDTVREQDVFAQVDLPDTVLFSAVHQLTTKVLMLADVQWTQWSRFEALRLKFSSIYAPTGVEVTNVVETPEHFRNTVRTSIGTEYHYRDKWTLKTGAAYDPTPTRPGFRTVRIPDADRFWLSMGVMYRLSARAHVDVGYAHIFFRSIEVQDCGPVSATNGMPVTASYIEGAYQTKGDVLGIQISWDLL
ncbi:MAG: outer membrane protein transport protein [Pseudomonadota bacterium]